LGRLEEKQNKQTALAGDTERKTKRKRKNRRENPVILQKKTVQFIHFLSFLTAEIVFVGENQFRPFQQLFVVETDFFEQFLESLPRRTSHSIGRRAVDVHHEEKNFRSFDMAQEVVAEAAVLVSSFDESGNIRDRNLLQIRIFHDSHRGKESGERISRHFRDGVGKSSEKRRLAGLMERRRGNEK
jgi:hypothetical protein